MEVVFKGVYLSFKEYVLLNLRYSIKDKPVIMGPLLLLPLVAIGTWIYLLTNLRLLSDMLRDMGLQLTILTLVGIVAPLATWRSFRRNYDSTKFLHAPTTYRFSVNGIQVDSPFLQSTSSWETIQALHVVNSQAILLNSNLTGFFLDFRNLEAPATEADFLALLQRHNIPIK